MYPLNLPVQSTPTVPAPMPGAPVLRVDGPVQPFPDLLAATAIAGETAADEPGKALPDAAEEPGNALPVAETLSFMPDLIVPVLPQLSPVAQALAPDERGAAPAASRALPEQADKPAFSLAPAAHETEPDPGPARPASARESMAVLAELVAAPARAAEPAPALAPVRDTPAAPPSAAAPSSQPAPGSQLEQLVEVLMQAREAGKTARSDLTVRHAEFGTVAIRLEQTEGETRAHISGRDPGFAPAVVAALGERGGAGFAEQHQRGQDQSWGQQAGAHSDARQHEQRRGAALPEHTGVLVRGEAADSGNEPSPPPSHSERPGRFA